MRLLLAGLIVVLLGCGTGPISQEPVDAGAPSVELDAGPPMTSPGEAPGGDSSPLQNQTVHIDQRCTDALCEPWVNPFVRDEVEERALMEKYLH